MLTGTIICQVSRAPITGVSPKNNREYAILNVSRNVRFGDKSYTRYASIGFNFGQAVKDASRCSEGDWIAVTFDDAQCETYDKDGKTKASLKLNGTSVTVIGGAPSSQPSRRAEPTERSGGRPSEDADSDVPF